MAGLGDVVDWARQQVASRVPKADLDQRDPDYIRDQFAGPVVAGVSEAISDHLDSFVDSDPESKLFGPVRGGCHLSDKVIRDALAPVLKDIRIQRFRIHT